MHRLTSKKFGHHSLRNLNWTLKPLNTLASPKFSIRIPLFVYSGEVQSSHLERCLLTLPFPIHKVAINLIDWNSIVDICNYLNVHFLSYEFIGVEIHCFTFFQ